MRVTVMKGLKIQARALSSSIRYTSSHEWVRYEGPEDDMLVGITDYAQSQLGDVVFVDYQVKPGDHVKQGKVIAGVESVKAASDIYMPIEGEVVAVNDVTVEDPALVNASPEKEGWFIKFKALHPQDVLDKLMEPAAYRVHLQTKKD